MTDVGETRIEEPDAAPPPDAGQDAGGPAAGASGADAAAPAPSGQAAGPTSGGAAGAPAAA